MFRSFLFASLALFFLLIFNGCASKTVPEAEVVPPPAVTEVEKTPAPEPATVEDAIPETPQSAGAMLNLDAGGLEIVFFDFDSYVLSAEARQLLKGNADWLLANQGVKATIEGHCDERGSDEYNLALGERRALATKDYLMELGIAPDRLAIISFGEERPADYGHDESAWGKNRRVEFK